MTLARPSAQALNQSAVTVAINLPGYGQPIPVVYGESRTAGVWLVYPVIHSGNLVFAVAWSWGEIESIEAIYINGAAVPTGGGEATITNYLGTDAQTPNSTLAAALAGFNDAYTGLAYSVFSVPTTNTIVGFPQNTFIEAVIQGRKVFDPRDDSTAYSVNPSLCMRDYIVSTRYGLGVPTYGVDECADFNDEVVSSFVRCEIGITVPSASPKTGPGTLDLLAAHAEVLYSFSDDGVLMVPDAPVDEPAAVISRSNIVEKSFRITGRDSNSAPTVVAVNWTDPSGAAAPWLQKTAVERLPGVETGDIEEMLSTVSFPGVQRISEAGRKALQRLRRLSHAVSFEWTHFDEGIEFQRGDVVQLPDIRGLLNQLVRTLEISLVERGLYKIKAEAYSPDMYPDDYVPDEITSIPVGGIIPFEGSSAPDGWALYGNADGRYLCGEDDTNPAGTEFGSTAWSVSTNTEPAGAHTGTAAAWIWGAPGGAGAGAWINNNVPADDHAHPVTGSGNYTPQHRSQKLIIKTGTPGSIPTNGIVLSNGLLISATLSEITSHLGRLNRADNSLGTGGASFNFSLQLAIGGAGAHTHNSSDAALVSTIDFDPAFSYVDAPNHNHDGASFFLSATANIKRRRLVHYLASAASDVIPGAIIGFDPSLTIPDGWYLCDGDNGTIDLSGYFIERSSLSNAGTAAGNNTISFSGTTSTDGGHTHRGSFQGNLTKSTGLHSDTAGDHAHPVSGSTAYIPPAFSMRFIQFTGVI